MVKFNPVHFRRLFVLAAIMMFVCAGAWASEADLKIPDLHASHFKNFGNMNGWDIMFYGALVICFTVGISIFQFFKIKSLPAHKSMLDVAETIYQTCTTYLAQQVKFLSMLFVIIAIAMSYYLYLADQKHEAPAPAAPAPVELAAAAAGPGAHGIVPPAAAPATPTDTASATAATAAPAATASPAPVPTPAPEAHQSAPKKSLGLTIFLVLLFSVVGMVGSTIVALYGIRVNTYANARTAFASLRGVPWDVVNIPLRAGMSVGLFLISIELVMMVIILLAVPRDIVGFCFLGFAIGESLGASALRIAGGIFTKIADIGSDLMKIVFKVKEDDPRNPGVIADCTGDNAGDSVGPTADGFETYGVTGVALISFICLAVKDPDLQAKLIVWIFAMRFLMDLMSGLSYFINQIISEAKYKGLKEFDFEEALTRLIFIAAFLCITTSFGMSYMLVGDLEIPGVNYLWAKLAAIITCGTLAAVLIPEFTKIFTSSHSKHVHEIVIASREGGSSLTILSGIVAGSFSAYWKGILIAGLMFAAYLISGMGIDHLMPHASVFAFGLVAYGFLCMGPVNIAVDSYGPVTDNAQSIFELAQTESIPGIEKEIERDFGFKPDFKQGKHYLEANDSAGNTFKATAKPVLIGTAVAGATTMIFSIILLLQQHLASQVAAGVLAAPAGITDLTQIGEVLLHAKLSLTSAPILLGFICGGAVIFWFTGASIQAVTTGAYSAVEYIKKNLDLSKKEADREDSKKVVAICTQYAQKGMWNIFIALLSCTLAFALFDPYFFIAYLVAIAVFGLFQAMYMANAGGSWDNAKKLVEVDFGEKGTDVHAATVVGDTVGDPFKDTTSVSLNPIIKFSTLFGMLAVEIAIKMDPTLTRVIGAVFFIISMVFVWRSFYSMRIPAKSKAK